jgi:hypothetical protein
MPAVVFSVGDIRSRGSDSRHRFLHVRLLAAVPRYCIEARKFVGFLIRSLVLEFHIACAVKVGSRTRDTPKADQTQQKASRQSGRQCGIPNPARHLL